MTEPWPPGQQPVDALFRFGTPYFAARKPVPPLHDRIIVAIDDTVLGEIPIAQITSLPRVTVIADFHCVTTWSVRGLTWSGFRWADVVGACVSGLGGVPKTAFVEIRGSDRAATCVYADDLAGEAILADRLNGEPLPIDHGAPLRLVAPKLYGYKNIKHVSEIAFRRAYRRGPAERQTMAHPRGRVAFEERGRFLPQIAYRYLYRSLIASTRATYRRADERADT